MSEPFSITNSNPEPRGIGGWLVLPLLGLIAVPLLATKTLFVDLLPALKPEAWASFTDPGSPLYSWYWQPYLLLSLLLNLALVFGSLLLLVLFLMKKKRVPFWMPIYYLLGVAVAGFESASLRYLFLELPEIADPKMVS